MHKGLFFGVITLVAFSSWAQDRSVESVFSNSAVGLGTSVAQYTGDVDVTYTGFGGSYSYVPNQLGPASSVTFTLPVYILADGSILQSRGFLWDAYIGYGRTWISTPDGPRDFFTPEFHLSGGIHLNSLTAFDPTGALVVASGGPSVMIITGNTLNRFRATFTVYQDIFTFAYAATMFGEGEVTFNSGLGAAFGLLFEI